MVSISIVVLASRTMSVSTLAEYCSKIVTARSSMAPYLLNYEEANTGNIRPDSIQAECLLDHTAIADCVKESGKDIMGMNPLQVSKTIFTYVILFLLAMSCIHLYVYFS